MIDKVVVYRRLFHADGKLQDVNALIVARELLDEVGISRDVVRLAPEDESLVLPEPLRVVVELASNVEIPVHEDDILRRVVIVARHERLLNNDRLCDDIAIVVIAVIGGITALDDSRAVDAR